MFARTMGARSDRFPLQQVKLVGEAVTFKVGRGRSTKLIFFFGFHPPFGVAGTSEKRGSTSEAQIPSPLLLTQVGERQQLS